jgi:hypothetical protein
VLHPLLNKLAGWLALLGRGVGVTAVEAGMELATSVGDSAMGSTAAAAAAAVLLLCVGGWLGANPSWLLLPLLKLPLRL